MYNGKGPYAFKVPIDTAAAGVIGRLPDNTPLLGLQNYDAFSQAKNWNSSFQSDVTVGATYYALGSLEYAGSAQFVFQIAKVNDDQSVDVDYAAFMLNTNSNTGNCQLSDRSMQIQKPARIEMQNRCDTNFNNRVVDQNE